MSLREREREIYIYICIRRYVHMPKCICFAEFPGPQFPAIFPQFFAIGLGCVPILHVQQLSLAPGSSPRSETPCHIRRVPVAIAVETFSTSFSRSHEQRLLRYCPSAFLAAAPQAPNCRAAASMQPSARPEQVQELVANAMTSQIHMPLASRRVIEFR